MTLPAAIEAIWNEMEAVRAEVLTEADGLGQRLADWRRADAEWSIGEILNHLAIAETQTGKLTTKLSREAEAAGTIAPYPADLPRFAPLSPASMEGMQAPQIVWPERGLPLDRLVADLRAVRSWSRQSIDRIAGLDPRRLTFKHFRLGELNIAQWWMLQAGHDALHLRQIRNVKASPGFPDA